MSDGLIYDAQSELERVAAHLDKGDREFFSRHVARLKAWDPVIRDIGTAIGKPIPSNCVVRILPIRTINAAALAVGRDGSFGISINAGLVAYIDGIAMIASRAMPLTGDVSEDYISCRHFSSVLAFLSGFHDRMPEYVPSERDSLYSKISQTCLFFCVAHEYSHLALDHHRIKRNADADPQLTNVNAIHEWTLSERIELDADLQGFYMTIAFADRAVIDLGLAIWSVDLFLKATAFLDRFTSNLIYPVVSLLIRIAKEQGREILLPVQKNASGSHPPTAARMAAFRHVLGSLAEGGAQNQLPTAISLAFEMIDRIDGFFHALWYATRDLFSEEMLKTLGQVPAKMHDEL